MSAILIIIYSAYLPLKTDARVIIVPVPWEVTVSYGAGTARALMLYSKASYQVDLFDPEVPEGWKQGFFMRAGRPKDLNEKRLPAQRSGILY